MNIQRPFNLKTWIEENRALLKPPVGNKCVYKDAHNYIVMIVGGPNSRKDYHYNESEELFYQLEGDVVLKIIEDGIPVDIAIREGEMFLLSPRVPHSPRRPANTVGLVIEKVRDAKDKDGLLWFCEKCNTKLHEEYFHLENIVTQLPPLMQGYYSSEEKRTCKKCGYVMEPPK